MLDPDSKVDLDQLFYRVKKQLIHIQKVTNLYTCGNNNLSL